jgi:GntR family transcriptional regulator
MIASPTSVASCPFCRAGFLPGEPAARCGRCGARHHRECYAVHGRCAVFACAGDELEGRVADEWTIQPDDPTPIGDQIAYRILYAIARGVYRPGDKLPTVRDVAARLRVNPNTVSKAYRDLERDGVLVSRRGTGVFVHEDALRTALERRQALVLERFERAVHEALDAGLEGAEIEEVVIEALRRAARSRRHPSLLDELERPGPRTRWTGKREPAREP